MLVTFSVSLGMSVKEGLAVGFILSILKMLRDLANPNLAVCGQLPDGTFRDVRNFPDARQLPNAVVVRMDARLGFFNARKMKEFCLTALNVRKNHGDSIEFLIIDARPINHIDLTGSEMLESLSESLHGHSQKLVVANVKTPVLKILAAAGVQNHLSHHEGHLCSDMDLAMKIVNKMDTGDTADKDAHALVEQSEKSRRVLQEEKGKCMVM